VRQALSGCLLYLFTIASCRTANRCIRPLLGISPRHSWDNPSASSEAACGQKEQKGLCPPRHVPLFPDLITFFVSTYSTLPNLPIHGAGEVFPNILEIRSSFYHPQKFQNEDTIWLLLAVPTGPLKRWGGPIPFNENYCLYHISINLSSPHAH
jgi:hypothetical protein